MCGTAGMFHKYMAGYPIIMKIEMYNVTMNVLNPNVMYQSLATQTGNKKIAMIFWESISSEEQILPEFYIS